MSGFAICSDKPTSGVILSVCHVNVWALQSLSLSPEFFFDVGVRFSVSCEMTEVVLQMYLPFVSESAEDLASTLENQTASLVFGEEIIAGDGKLEFPNRVDTFSGKGRLQLHLIQMAGQMELLRQENTSQGSIWKMKVMGPLSPNKFYYFRVRFKSFELGKVWQVKRSWFTSNGAIVDLRFSDIRDWLGSPNPPNVNLILPVDVLQVFVISPAAFQLRASSPELRYVRTLETTNWEQYLKRAASFKAQTKYLIYYWKLSDKDKISTILPGRMFLDLSRDFGSLRLNNFIRFAIVLILVNLVLPLSAWRDVIFSEAKSIWQAYQKPLSIYGVISIAILAVGWIKKGQSLLAWLDKALKSATRFIFGRWRNHS